ncbi:MAG: hypothetical protein ACLSCV_11755 [Acutalibacteraceae bacterium]
MGTSRQYSGKRRNTKIRMVPFQTISGVACFLHFHRESYHKIRQKQIETEDVYIAVCQENYNDGFKALLNPDLFSQGKEIVMGRKC